MAQDKHLKTPNVPPLRFPGFTDEWKIYTLSNFFDFKNGLNPDAKRFGTGTKFISVSDILNNDYIDYDRIIASVTPTEKELEEFGVNRGDILFQRSSETLEDVGRANVYLDDRTALFGGFVIRGKKKEEYEPYFMRYALSSPVNRKKVIVKGAGAQHFNIGQDGLSKVSISVSTIDEQTKIGALLRLIDERIATQNKIIDNLQSLIKGLAKTHYDFCKTLSAVKIRELGESYSVMNLSKEQLSDNGQPCILYGELFTLYGPVIESICSKTNIELKLSLSSGKDLLFPSSTTVDALSLIAPSALTKPNIILGGDMFGIKVANEYSPEYLSYYFNYIGNHELAKYAIGSTIIHLHYKDIAEHTIAIPTLTDQLLFVKLASTMKSKIENEKSVLHNLKTLKAYLLQAMFI